MENISVEKQIEFIYDKLEILAQPKYSNRVFEKAMYLSIIHRLSVGTKDWKTQYSLAYNEARRWKNKYSRLKELTAELWIRCRVRRKTKTK